MHTTTSPKRSNGSRVNRQPVLRLWDAYPAGFDHAFKLIIDGFAGAGGASEGIEKALGRSADVAMNHNAYALSIHAANNPDTHHMQADIHDVDPRTATCGRPVGFAWFSPDCTHHSKAKGNKPLSNSLRGLANVIVAWAQDVQMDCAVVENVEEFLGWGPLIQKRDKRGELVWQEKKKKDGGGPLLDVDGDPVPYMIPDPQRTGEYYDRWIAKLQAAGYVIEHRVLVADQFGSPTTRRRLFIIMRRDGQPIVWPEATHGDGLLPMREAHSIIDWDTPTNSIFDRRKPLADDSLVRLVKGVRKFVQETDAPYTHEGNGLVARSYVMKANAGEHGAVGSNLNEPMHTITGRDSKQLVTAFLMRYNGHGLGSPMTEPVQTITGKDRFARIDLVLEPADVARKRAAVHELLDGDTLVDIDGIAHVVVDIGQRMLTARELFDTQGFDASFVIDPELNGKTIPRYAQVKCAGNSVCPDVAEAIVAANYKEAA